MSTHEMLENMRIDRDRWRETVRLVFDMCHLQQEVTPIDVVDLIERRHAAFFGAEWR